MLLKRTPALVALALVALVFAGCGGDDDDDDASASAPAEDTTETTAPAEEGDDEAVESPSGENAEGTGATDPWRMSTYNQDFDADDQLEFDCPPDGEAARVWGTDVYTDDSSLCTAAVHAGLITVDDGGAILVELAPGEESYEGSTANGITTESYGPWSGSFVFPEDQPSN